MMKKRIFICILLLAALNITAQQNFTLSNPPDVAEVLGRDFISTGLSERDFALSPEGTELFYTLQAPQFVFQTILHSTKDKNGYWAKPEIASFAGRFSDLEPAFSPDGKKLYFASNRPISGNDIKDFDIWVVKKENGKWGEPENIGLPVNTSADEFYPSVTKNGNLYFTAAYPNGVGKEDIYFAKRENGTYAAPVPLDTAVNSVTYEFNAYVSPDEDLIIFTSYGRKDDRGRGDLYMSIKNASGKWQPAKNLSLINSDKLDYCPFVSFDKKTLFFTSERISIKKSFAENPAKIEELIKSYTSVQNGGGDIYRISFEKVLEHYSK